MVGVKKKVKKSEPVKEPKTYKQWLAKADAVFSVYIRTRDNYTCVVCGSPVRPQCGHLIRRSRLLVRFDEYNCHCQCADCNYRHEYFPKHYFAAFLRIYGKGDNAALLFHQLMELAHGPESRKKKKFTIAELKSLVEHYEEKTKLLMARKVGDLRF